MKFFHQLNIAFFMLNVKISFGKINRKYSKILGRCNNFNNIQCSKDSNCPGYCDNQSKKPGAKCSKHKDCTRGICIYNNCILATGFCEQNKNRVCNSNNDCSVCSTKSKNADSKCKNDNECTRGKCMKNIKCKFPTGVCEEGKTVCENKYDCPGRCSSKTRNPGDSCTGNNQCKGFNARCIFERCISDAPNKKSKRKTKSKSPTKMKTKSPTKVKTIPPTVTPTSTPTEVTYISPSSSSKPSLTPSSEPSGAPSDVPSKRPSLEPSTLPSSKPTLIPSVEPSILPSAYPSSKPSLTPSTKPSLRPSDIPSERPSKKPSNRPSTKPSLIPSTMPSSFPSTDPSTKPSQLPSSEPSGAPSDVPSYRPSVKPSLKPSHVPSAKPSLKPSLQPSRKPSSNPSDTPSFDPSSKPSDSDKPSFSPSDQPSLKPSDQPSLQPSGKPSVKPSKEPSHAPSVKISSNPSVSSKPSHKDEPSVEPSLKPSLHPSRQPSSKPSDIPSHDPSSKPSYSDIPSDQPSLKPSYMSSSKPSVKPSVEPSRAASSKPSAKPSTNPSSRPSEQPIPVTLEEALLSDKLFGPSSSICSNYVPENGEYSFTFNLTELPYFDDSLSDIEEVMFQVQIGHADSNSNRTWSIRVGKGGHIYSFQGPYGESIPPNKKVGMRFVDEVNQKVCVDSTKNQDNNDNGYFVHQAGVYQDGDPGYTDQMPFWFSPNIAIYCSTSVPECRLASWGQQSYVRAWTERIIYYDRYRDCGDGILERTHLIHNAEIESTETVLTFTNMPWGGTRYTNLKDFVFSQNPDTWDYDTYNLTGGIEDPMLIFGIDDQYGSNVVRDFYSTWTLGYTIFAQDLPFVTTPSFKFPGRLPPQTNNQLTLIVDYGTINSNWICQGPLNGYTHPNYGNYRCRLKNLGSTMIQGCFQCYLRLTNEFGDSFSVFNVRNWLVWTPSLGCSLIYFNSDETITKIRQVMANGATITVSWDETGMRPEDNLALAFVHGRSEGMIIDNKNPAKIRFGHANNVERDFAVFEYIPYPNLAFGDSFRARQYYITDSFTGLSERSAALANETIEEVIESGEFDFSDVHLHYVNDGQINSFGSTIDDDPCHNAQTTTIACTGSSTPQLGKFPLLQIDCSSSPYVGIDFYHFSNFPARPYRVMNCKVDGVTTSTRPSVKLLGYFNEAECGTVLQNRTYDDNFCNE